VQLGSHSILFDFQVVYKQVDVPRDGILGSDFFLHIKAQVSYDSQSVKVGKGILGVVDETTEGQD